MLVLNESKATSSRYAGINHLWYHTHLHSLLSLDAPRVKAQRTRFFENRHHFFFWQRRINFYGFLMRDRLEREANRYRLTMISLYVPPTMWQFRFSCYQCRDFERIWISKPTTPKFDVSFAQLCCRFATQLHHQSSSQVQLIPHTRTISSENIYQDDDEKIS